jgi:cyclopropane fatty-acyl-phospholipid synthase-like methyltransferase
LVVAVYDLLALHYDAVAGDSATEAAFIDSIITRAHPQPVTLLEAACGTGGIITSLTGRYQVAGLDISPGMLDVAREKLPEGTPLYLADMSCFRVGVKFDAIICVYHGINHLLGFSAWESFFDCVHEHLNDGGVFAFDSLTIGNLQRIASGPRIVQRFGENYLHITVRTSGEAVFDWNVEVLELQQDGRYELLTQVIRTATFPLERIQAALVERFTSIEIIESDGGVNDDGENRIWFVCTRPRSAVQ